MRLCARGARSACRWRSRRASCSRPRTIRSRSPTARSPRAFDRSASRCSEIEAALTADDADLAKSFVELARRSARRAAAGARAQRVEAAVTRGEFGVRRCRTASRAASSPASRTMCVGPRRHRARRSVRVRRHPRRGPRGLAACASGETDELVLGLACVGLAVTAGTYASFGAAAPARVGLSARQGGAQDRPARRRRWPPGSAARCARWSTGHALKRAGELLGGRAGGRGARARARRSRSRRPAA